MRAVLTIAVGDEFSAMAALTHPAMAAYARALDADFVSLNAAVPEPHFLKRRLADFLTLYDRILYLDTDIVVTPDCPDIFDLVAPDRFGAWFVNPMIPGRFADRIAAVQSALGDIGWTENYFNSGVMVVSPLHRPIFEDLGGYQDSFFEQTLLNYRVQQQRAPTIDLGQRWNHTGAAHWNRRLQSHFVHYAGTSSRLDLIRADLAALAGP